MRPFSAFQPRESLDVHRTLEKALGSRQDPFNCEDADKDLILTRMDASAVHSGFDRLFGDPASPSPGIVFGEKGSGKSGLRLTMRRRLEAYNEAHPDDRVFWNEYNDFDGFLEQFRRSIRASGEPADVAKRVLGAWSSADHLDAMLCLGVTRLVDEVVDERRRPEKLTRKQKADLLLLTALYYHSSRHTTVEALARLRSTIGFRSPRRGLLLIWRLLLTVLAAGIALWPHFGEQLGYPAPWEPMLWYGIGGFVALSVWLQAFASRMGVQHSVRRTVRSIRVVSRDGKQLAQILNGLPPGLRREFALPRVADEATRFDFMMRFQALLSAYGYRSWYVLFDRVDEPSALNADGDGSRRFVERILDHKLLQLPGLGLKLFLPIELDEIYRNATPDQLKRMRLDKSNLVSTLDWTGQELYEIANHRLKACLKDEARIRDLDDFFADDFDRTYLRTTLENLGTPRYALGFLASLFQEYARNLDGELPDDAPEWRIGRMHFDIVRSNWLERATLLRRKLN